MENKANATEILNESDVWVKVTKFCAARRPWAFDFFLLADGSKIRAIDVIAWS